LFISNVLHINRVDDPSIKSLMMFGASIWTPWNGVECGQVYRCPFIFTLPQSHRFANFYHNSISLRLHSGWLHLRFWWLCRWGSPIPNPSESPSKALASSPITQIFGLCRPSREYAGKAKTKHHNGGNSTKWHTGWLNGNSN
jgi:hypothetical protein